MNKYSFQRFSFMTAIYNHHQKAICVLGLLIITSEYKLVQKTIYGHTAN